MKIKIIFSLMLIGFLFLNGCVTPPNVPLKQGAADTINTSHLIILSTQHQINAEIEESHVATAMGGGIIPALIDAAIETSRSNEAEENITSVRSVLKDYDFGMELKEALASKFPSITWLDIQPIDIFYNKQEELIDELLSTEKKDSLMVLEPSYTLSPDFTTLKVQAVLTLYSISSMQPQKDPNSFIDHEEAMIYKRSVFYSYPLNTTVENESEAAMQWSKEQGDLIRKALTTSADKIGFMLVQALKNPSA